MSTIGPELPPHLLNRTRSSADRNDEEESNPNVVGPQIPSDLLKQDEEEDEDDYVPELPPDMVAGRSAGPSTNATSTSKRVVGPSMPSYPPTYDPRHHASYSDDDDDDDDFGPKPLPAGVRHVEFDPVKQFMEKEEKRRKEIEVRNMYTGLGYTYRPEVRKQPSPKL